MEILCQTKLFYLMISSRFYLLPLATAPSLNMHDYVKCISRIQGTNSKKYFNKRLCRARVVTENTYGMLKCRWHFLYNKNRVSTFQFTLRHHGMYCIA